MKIKNQITKNLGTKTQPDSAFQLSVTTIEEQGILESFSRLPQDEREIVRQLLDKFGSQRVAAIRFPVPFDIMKRWRRGVTCAPWYIGAEPPLTRFEEAPLPRSSPRYPASATVAVTALVFSLEGPNSGGQLQNNVECH